MLNWFKQYVRNVVLVEQRGYRDRLSALESNYRKLQAAVAEQAQIDKEFFDLLADSEEDREQFQAKVKQWMQNRSNPAPGSRRYHQR